MTVTAPAALLRGFATDFLTSHDPAAARQIMADDYRLTIGGHVFAGRDDAYLPATVAQLGQFPGLIVTVHDVVLGANAVAMRFTEHGVSVRDGRAAAWGGITLFRIADERLAEGWAEEDYLARKRQLKSGTCDPVRAPQPAPWDAPVEAANPAAEETVRTWLSEPANLLGTEEIAAEGPLLRELIAPMQVEVTTLFSAGPRVAFHAQVMGTSVGGFGKAGTPASLAIAAIVDVEAGQVGRVQLCADRLGLQRRSAEMPR